MLTPRPPQVPVAIIGIGCIFAQSSDSKSFLHLINRGINAISEPPESHHYLTDYFDPDPKKPDHIYCNRGGYLPRVAFDPTEFSIPPNALEATDTSQLLGLMTAKKALDDAGYGTQGKSFDRTKASVILGVTGTQELVIPLGARLGHPLWQRALQAAGVPDPQAADVMARISDGYVSWQENSFPGLLGNVVAGRIANRLDLGGTNCVVDAACASSMGAIHMALFELTTGQSDLVITGGVDTINDAFMHMCFSKTKILSASGDIRPFSKDADGTVLGEGVGMVVLKRLADAEKDGDRVYAVIKGIGSASDGKSQSIYAPRPEGQARALQRAYQAAGIDPASVELVEAHGTGTRVGDQVEFQALRDVFGAISPNGNRCALGSVKSNIGHTKAAAGTAGLIKAALSIYHKVLPPTLKADAVDPDLGIEHSPFYLNTRLRPWLSTEGEKRRAGVSAFGFGGSNFHTVLEEHRNEKLESSWDGAIELAAFSGESQKALEEQIALWAKQVEEQPGRQGIGKLARQSRDQFSAGDAHRLVMTLDLTQPEELIQTICRQTQSELSDDKAPSHAAVFHGSGPTPGGVAFLFPGQGSQYVGMGRDLICCFPDSLTAFERAASFFKEAQGLNDYVNPRLDSANPAHETQLRQTQVAQPAIGAVSVAMLKALAFFGVAPDATCGHSYGELTALHAAGWMTQDDLWHLSIARGRLMADAGQKAAETGAMLAVQAPLESIAALVATLKEPVVLANRNSHQQGVLSGTLTAIEAASNACNAKGWRTVRLPVAAAFHSPLVSKAQKPFGLKVAAVRLTPGATAVMSNTRGNAYPQDAESAAALLGGQLALPVDFVGNIEALYAKGIRTFVEVGPKNILTNLVRQTLDGKPIHAVALDQSCGRQSGVMDLALTLGQLAVWGYDVQLGRWEKATAPGRKTRMAISISGANYRNPKSAPTEASGHAARPEIKSSLPASADKRSVQPSILSEPKSMDPSTQKALQSAMTTVQQGLASLQALQAQTTQAHQQYLETQAEASRTLQQLIQSTQQLTASSLGSPVPALPMVSMPAAHQPVDTAPPSGQQHPLSAPSVRPNPGPRTDPSLVQQNLIEIVSQLTGYPTEMLALEMDIEADLGIDSIKRVEILSALEEKMPHLARVTPDMMGTLKTLGQICDYLIAPTPQPPTPASQPAGVPMTPTSQPAAHGSIERQIVALLPTPLPEQEETHWPSEYIFGLVGAAGPLGTALVDALGKHGLKAIILTRTEELLSSDNLCALMLMAPLSAREAFEWAKAAGPLLQHAAAQGPAGLFTISFLDGAFGFSGGTIQMPEQGALAGLAKTARLEWPDVRCLALDIDPAWQDCDAVSRAVALEVMHAGFQGRMEIGLSSTQRIGLQLILAELPGPTQALDLTARDVVVVTGGARGVTAAAAAALSAHAPCTLALLGRSPAPQPEPQWLVGVDAPNAMKQAIITHLFEHQRPTPAQVEGVFNQYSTNREMQTTLDQLAQMGVTARYFSVDVRNPAAVNASLDMIRKELGPIKGIIHGAGVLEDRLIVDKQRAQFEKVYSTKVEGLQTLLDATREDALRYLVLFSSVSARMGNNGQVDYAMANEVLNKMACQQAQLKPACKVMAINWGPWDGGMVTPGLKQTFIDRGVGLIPLDLGARAMVAEMAQPLNGPTEMVIGSSLHKATPCPELSVVTTATPDTMTLTCKREINIDNHPFLHSHQLDGRPVVPLALITEWLAHSALHANPGLTLHGIDQLRLCNGIAMDRQNRWVCMLAGKAQRKGPLFEVAVEIRNGAKEPRQMVHSNAKAILAESLPAAPKFIENGHFKHTPQTYDLDDIYGRILFHGRDLRGIREILSLTDHGMCARILAAPPPAQWISEPLRSSWIADPLMLDSAFQLAIVWCHEQFGQVCLPSYAETYRQYCRHFPAQGVFAVMVVQKFTERKLVCDFTFLNQKKKVVAELKGYEAVMAPNLLRAFKAA
jgi:acyl transferase domain-containing protein/NAD(P)-dependent dehydrogenase (short-subunit alcohol dehydrogenase family)